MSVRQASFAALKKLAQSSDEMYSLVYKVSMVFNGSHLAWY